MARSCMGNKRLACHIFMYKVGYLHKQKLNARLMVMLSFMFTKVCVLSMLKVFGQFFALGLIQEYD